MVPVSNTLGYAQKAPSPSTRNIPEENVRGAAALLARALRLTAQIRNSVANQNTPNEKAAGRRSTTNIRFCSYLQIGMLGPYHWTSTAPATTTIVNAENALRDGNLRDST